MNEVSKLYINGLTQGLKDNAYLAVAKANEIAAAIIEIFRSLWVISSPSKVGIGLTKNFVKGLEIGMDGSDLLDKSASMANGIVDSVQSNLFESNQVTNNYNDRSLTTNVNVNTAGGNYEIEKMWRRLIRQQAVAIAR